MKNTVLRKIASAFDAYQRCIKHNNSEWESKWEEEINQLVKDYFPSGSGIDSGCKFDWDRSRNDRLVFTFGFHHMNDGGYYDGWTDHSLVVTPSLQFGFDMKITGKDRNQIKEYLYQVFAPCLEHVIDVTEEVHINVNDIPDETKKEVPK